MRLLISLLAAALVCSCQANEPCNRERALRIATAHAKAHPGMAYFPDEKASINTDGHNYRVAFFKPGFGIGGGLTVWVDGSSCKVTQSLLGQ